MAKAQHPAKVGDRVLINSGVHSGKEATIKEIAEPYLKLTSIEGAINDPLLYLPNEVTLLVD